MLNNIKNHTKRELISPYFLFRETLAKENPDGDKTHKMIHYIKDLVKDIDPVRSL